MHCNAGLRCLFCASALDRPDSVAWQQLWNTDIVVEGSLLMEQCIRSRSLAPFRFPVILSTSRFVLYGVRS
jgi:hypothetical protein